jgi:hypothetical protein
LAIFQVNTLYVVSHSVNLSGLNCCGIAIVELDGINGKDHGAAIGVIMIFGQKQMQ